MTLTAPISTIMTRGVHTLDVSAKLSEVRRALITNDFHHMPIVDGKRLVGMISWRDLVRAYRSAHEDAMTRELVTVRDDDSIDRAIDLIADAHVHSVLVLDSESRLAGIVTDKDIVDYLRG